MHIKNLVQILQQDRKKYFHKSNTAKDCIRKNLIVGAPQLKCLLFSLLLMMKLLINLASARLDKKYLSVTSHQNFWIHFMWIYEMIQYHQIIAANI